MGSTTNEEKKGFVFCVIAGDTQTDVHIEGCKDIQRGLALYGKTMGGHSGERAYQDVHVVEANTAEEAVEGEIEELNSDFGEGVWSSQYFTVMPCCRRR